MDPSRFAAVEECACSSESESAASSSHTFTLSLCTDSKRGSICDRLGVIVACELEGLPLPLVGEPGNLGEALPIRPLRGVEGVARQETFVSFPRVRPFGVVGPDEDACVVLDVAAEMRLEEWGGGIVMRTSGINREFVVFRPRELGGVAILIVF